MNLRKIDTRLAIIASIAACISWSVSTGLFNVMQYVITASSSHNWVVDTDASLFAPLSISLTVVACYLWLLVHLQWSDAISETRCRSCRHVLRGLSEPKCPECGERI